MARPAHIEIPDAERIPILYEDRAVLAIDKPPGWMLAPSSWQQTRRNLQSLLEASLKAGDYWARSRNLKFLRFVHRLDADTSGILLMVKSPGAIKAFTELFESRRVEKVYLAVVHGSPSKAQWSCKLPLGPDRKEPARTVVDKKRGKAAETRFRVLCLQEDKTLVQVQPLTGRMHQIRVHLAASGCPVIGDKLYGPSETGPTRLGLRAVRLSYPDPFSKRKVEIVADSAQFLSEFGFPPRLSQSLCQ